LLRHKIPLVGTLTLTTLVVALYAVLHVLLVRSFTELEAHDTTLALDQIRNAITNETDRLSSIAADYGAWDDTYEFMAGRDPRYVEQNQTVDGLVSLRINLMALLDLDGRIVAARQTDLDAEADMVLENAVRATLEKTPELRTFDGLEDHRQGLVMTARGPMLFASAPIVTTFDQGPARGTIVIGKHLDDRTLQRIAAITSLDVTVYPWSASGIPASARRARDDIERGAESVVVPVSGDVALGYGRLDDITGAAALQLEVATGRAVYRHGLHTLRHVAIAMLVGGLGLITVLLLGVNSQILRRLTRLSSEVSRVGRSANPHLRTTRQQADELGNVADEINQMLDALQQSSAALRESEQKFRLTFETARDAILWVDPETGLVQRCNQSASLLTGRPRETIVGQPLARIAEPEAIHPVLEAIRSPTLATTGFATEACIVTPDGAVHTCEFSGALTVVDGKPIVQVVIRDLTLQRSMEKERAELEAQLHQAQKMEAVGQLAGGVAHDFNNYLAGIAGYADLIRRRFGNLDAGLEKYASIIFDTAGRAAELTTKLLTFARKSKVERHPVDVHRAIDNIAHLLERILDPRIHLELRLRADASMVMGDDTQLQNVVMNLALNARDAMPDGGELRVETDVVRLAGDPSPLLLPPGSYLHVRVIDTGTGMDAHVQARAFEPFFTTKAPGKGTGLGLASAYGTVRNHGGDIVIESEPGGGSTFHVYLPLTEAAAAANEHAAGVLAKGSGNILVVDDEPLVLEVTADLLREIGYTVTCVADGVAAVEWFREHARDTDLVILDMIMPRMGGADCFLELQKIDPEVRIIVASGYSEDDHVSRVIAGGAVAFLQKPYDLTRLARVIAGALRRDDAPHVS
jgi:PAS domain S-box-containing protein